MDAQGVRRDRWVGWLVVFTASIIVWGVLLAILGVALESAL